MKIVFITDTHFGCRNNSMTWWKSQEKFFRNQFIPYIKKLKEDERDLYIVHLGDVFDIRSSISTFIMKEVRELFVDIAKIAPLLLIAGNHDFYSPANSDYCSIEEVFRDTPGIKMAIREPMKFKLTSSDTDIFEAMVFPWPVAEKYDMHKLKAGYTVFTHADVTVPPLLDSRIFSGHIHIPLISGNCRNLGSCFALNFADANQDRCFYVWDPFFDELKGIPNTESIRFYRLYDEEILDFKSRPEDYIEIYIKQSNLISPQYQQAVKELQEKYKNLWIIPKPDMNNSDTDVEITNIDDLIEKFIPDNCREKFNYIKEKL